MNQRFFQLNFFCYFVEKVISSTRININTKWRQNGLTIAGGNGKGDELNQLSSPLDIDIDDDNQRIYIADQDNHRIVEWKFGAKKGQVVAGGTGKGSRTDQLNEPTHVVVDKKNNSLIICDSENRRVVQWSLNNRTNGQTIISDIACSRLATDINGDFYVSDNRRHEVRRWKLGDKMETVVAGGNGHGINLNQFQHPCSIFVDEDRSVYVSDYFNHRVMKWIKGAKEGVVVAGGQGGGNSLTQLNSPNGIAVDHLGNVYVAESLNNRITRWVKGSKQGSIIVGGNGKGAQPNQFSFPADLSFDREGNLYVVDLENHRVQKFDIDSN
jgi:DNA-binding beta-propeller fold protein YncE